MSFKPDENGNEKNDLSFESAVLEHNKLYSSKAPEAGKKRIDFYKNVVANSLEKWRNQNHNLKVTIFPDLKGLKIDIGEDGTSGIHTHVPYHLLTLELVEKFEADLYAQSNYQNFIKYNNYADKLYRHNPLLLATIIEAYNRNPNDFGLTQEQYQKILQLAEHDLALFSENLYQADAGGPRNREFICGQVFSVPDKLADQVRSGYPITKETLEMFFTQKSRFTTKEKIMRLVRFASYVQIDDEASTWSQSKHLPHISFNLSNESKRLYDLQKATLRKPYMIQVGKCIEEVLSRFSFQELKDLGITVCTSAYGEGERMIAFWSEGEYSSVLLKPAVNISAEILEPFEFNKDGQKSDEQVILSRSEFETLDTNMRLAITAEKLFAIITTNDYGSDTEQKFDAARYLNSIFARELPSDISNTFSEATTEYIKQNENSDKFLEICKKTMQAYRTKVWRMPKILLQEHLQNPKKIEVKFGPTYNQSYPESHLPKDDHKRSEPFSPLLTNLPELTVPFAVSMTPDAIPFAQCARMMRLLKLEPKNTITCLVGSSKMKNPEGSEVSQRVATAIYNVAKKIDGNVGMPGTQPGYAGILLQPVLADKNESNKPDYFSIIPGKNVWFEGNPYFDFSDTKHSFAAVPNKAFVDPFDGGWGKNAQEVKQHNQIQESIYAAMSDGFKRATVLADSGYGGTTEMTMALHNNSPIFLVTDSQRLAQITSALIEKFPLTLDNKEHLTNSDNLKQSILSLDLDDEAKVEIEKVTKDSRYIDELALFFREAVKKPEKIIVTTSIQLESDMLKYFLPTN